LESEKRYGRLPLWAWSLGENRRYEKVWQEVAPPHIEIYL